MSARAVLSERPPGLGAGRRSRHRASGDTAESASTMSEPAAHENMVESEELRARAALEADEPRAKAAALRTALEVDQRRDPSVANGPPMSSAHAARRAEALASRSPK